MSQTGGQLSFKHELEEMRPLVEHRAGHVCERCGAAPIDHVHHRLRRSQGGTNMLVNLLGVCRTMPFSPYTTVHRSPTKRAHCSEGRSWNPLTD